MFHTNKKESMSLYVFQNKRVFKKEESFLFRPERKYHRSLVYLNVFGAHGDLF